ncbi:NADP-dependent oxidoreductase [Nocardiopsis gilva YIM 90087]|uniref:NADP-dependent oxidoreductase n=1 Tax=Nocardiopsis gilva YIM 90087 TaxID=1235441 RepID=A0A223SAF7_9ACTN|nr:NADP-dependent oxidoreductase [Nocardiopsis gilva]ASU85112.1 NADP-dependent oxidoreductase [Nocardiopsis gilva YIM 90087]
MSTNAESPASTTREWQLAARPVGWPKNDDFRFVERELPDLQPGEVRVRNTYISVDPYMRGRMNDVKSYIPPFQLDEAMTGGAVGEVVASRSDDLAVGDTVLHFDGWRTLAQGPAKNYRKVSKVPGLPESVFLHVLGMTGLTAYVGLLDIAEFKEGDTVFVSGAAGAVGSVVGQIARLKGAKRVIGSAGSQEKVDLLTGKYGFDAAFNYKDGDVREQLAQAAPEGIDVYFDNVGGDHLEAALKAFNNDGRAALCGMISVYNATEPQPAPRNLFETIKKGLTLRGFTVGGYYHRFDAFAAEVGEWLSKGDFVYDETVVDGIEQTRDAFLDMLRGANVGKMLVRVG